MDVTYTCQSNNCKEKLKVKKSCTSNVNQHFEIFVFWNLSMVAKFFIFHSLKVARNICIPLHNDFAMTMKMIFCETYFIIYKLLI